MKKTAMLKILSPILLLLIINQALTGIFRMKLSYETFVSLHESGGALLVFLVLAHLLLNFNWIKTNYFAR
jgi:heme A synthase